MFLLEPEIAVAVEKELCPKQRTVVYLYYGSVMKVETVRFVNRLCLSVDLGEISRNRLLSIGDPSKCQAERNKSLM